MYGNVKLVRARRTYAFQFRTDGNPLPLFVDIITFFSYINCQPQLVVCGHHHVIDPSNSQFKVNMSYSVLYMPQISVSCILYSVL